MFVFIKELATPVMRAFIRINLFSGREKVAMVDICQFKDTDNMVVTVSDLRR